MTFPCLGTFFLFSSLLFISSVPACPTSCPLPFLKFLPPSIPHALPFSSSSSPAENNGKKPTFAEQLREKKKAMEDRVRAKRPSLIERLQIMNARDRAKARSVRAMAGALRAAYTKNQKPGDADDKWMDLALKDNLLDEEEVMLLKMTPEDDAEGAGAELGKQDADNGITEGDYADLDLDI